MTQISIGEVCPKNELYPMIVSFQNGYVSEQFPARECMAFENKNSKRKTVATIIDKLIYAGEEKSEELSKTFILARNKRTGKVRLIESSVLEMQPILKSADSTSTEVVLDTSALELSRKFGSKKNKTYMEQREKLKVNIETVTKQMQKVTEEVTKDDLDLTAYEINTKSDDFYIPPINRAATLATDIYHIDSILTEEQYKRIHSELEGKDYMSDMIPLIRKLVENNKLSAKLLVLAVYANCLVEMYSVRVVKIKLKNFMICPHSVTLNELILRNFCTTVNGKRNRPLPYKDKALCYSLVLILILNGLKIEVQSLAVNLKVADKTLLTKLRLLGATVTSSGSNRTAQLKLPLSSVPLRRKSTKF